MHDPKLEIHLEWLLLAYDVAGKVFAGVMLALAGYLGYGVFGPLMPLPF